MLDGLITLLDRVIQLLERQSVRRRSLFSDYIEPLFTDLAAIHSDYRETLDEVSKLMVDAPLPTLVEQLRSRKRELEPVRQKVLALLRAIYVHQKLPQEARAFFQSASSYFGVTAGEGLGFRASGYTTLLDALDNAASCFTTAEESSGDDEVVRHSREHFASTFKKVANHLDAEWRNILDGYASAKVDLLRSA
jgi:hypothetical protein